MIEFDGLHGAHVTPRQIRVETKGGPVILQLNSPAVGDGFKLKAAEAGVLINGKHYAPGTYRRKDDGSFEQLLPGLTMSDKCHGEQR